MFAHASELLALARVVVGDFDLDWVWVVCFLEIAGRFAAFRDFLVLLFSGGAVRGLLCHVPAPFFSLLFFLRFLLVYHAAA